MKRSLAVPALVVASVVVGGGYVYWKYFAADDDLPQSATPVRTVSSPLDKERLDKERLDKERLDKQPNDNTTSVETTTVAATPSDSPASATPAPIGTGSRATAASKSTTPTPTLLPDTIRFGNAPAVRSQNMPEFSAKENAGLTGVQLPGAVTTGPQLGPQLKLPPNPVPAPTTIGPAPLPIQVSPAAGVPTLPFNNGPAGQKAPSILQPAGAAPGFDPAVLNNPAPKVVSPQIPGLGQ